MVLMVKCSHLSVKMLMADVLVYRVIVILNCVSPKLFWM